MDHDNKISALLNSETAQFDQSTHKELLNEQIKFTLESEFEKTRKNHTLVTPFLTLATIAAIGIAIFVIYQISQNATRNIPMDLNAFQSENIKEFLDAVKKNQTALDGAKGELAALDSAYALAAQRIDQELDYAKELNKSLKLGAKELATRDRKAEQEAERKKDALRAEYEPKMAEKMAIISSFEKRIAATDSTTLASAEKQQELVDIKSKLYDLEIAKIKSTYEAKLKVMAAAHSKEVKELGRQRAEMAAALKAMYEKEIADTIAKYNPTFKDDRTASLLLKGVGSFGAPIVRDYPEPFTAESVGSATDFSTILKTIDDFLFLSKTMRSVEYINSVPQALAAIEATAYDALLGYQRLVESAAGKLGELRGTITDMQMAMERVKASIAAFAAKNGAQGYVIDPSDPTRLVLMFTVATMPVNGAIATVTRGGVVIATIQLSVRGLTEVTGKVMSIIEGKTVEPFDVIVLR